MRPRELIEARSACREGRIDAERLRGIEDCSILTALELQKEAGIDVFTAGEYRRGNFMADFASSLDGMMPSESIMAPIRRGPNRELANEFRRSDGETVVLGLITTKEPQSESEDVLRRRIDEAAKYVPLENLALSTQCGFASTLLGNLISWDDMRRKLELVAKVARTVWD